MKVNIAKLGSGSDKERSTELEYSELQLTGDGFVIVEDAIPGYEDEKASILLVIEDKTDTPWYGNLTEIIWRRTLTTRTVKIENTSMFDNLKPVKRGIWMGSLLGEDEVHLVLKNGEMYTFNITNPDGETDSVVKIDLTS